MARRENQQTVKRPVIPAAARITADDDLPPESEAPGSERDGGAVDSGLGRYQLLFELARGGMGTVHVGRLRGAHGFDRLVAIKLLRSDPGGSGDLESFLAEARVTARISHPNIVQTLELGEYDGRPFIVMELIQGVSLARLSQRILRAGERLEPRLLMWILSRVATGLHAAHEAALIHRDVSPENVLISFEGRVYVADFGVAKFTEADKQTQSGVVKGKFAYMSPEQTEGRELDRRSDLFALGIVMHESLTGERLFAGNSMADTIRRIWSIVPVDPAKGRRDVPAALGKLVLRCLEKDRDGRPATAGDVALELRRILRSENAVVDEEDVGALVRHYFKGEPEKLKRRIDEAIRAASGDPTPSQSARLQIAPDALEPSPEGSVTASVSTAPSRSGPPLTPRRYAGAWLALGAAVVIGGGALVLRSLGSPAATQEPVQAATTDASAPAPLPSPAPPPPREIAPAPKEEPSAEAPEPSVEPSTEPVRSPPPKASHAPLPELGPKMQLPPTGPSGSPRGKPIDVFDE
jgi:serine/threonine protein kinase